MANTSTRNALAVMWISDDPVHPSEDTYATLASNILHILETASEKGSNKKSPSASTQPLKRPR
jgi:hypothetical protein